MGTRFRALGSEEIRLLGSQGCSSEDWSKVEVAEGFEAGRLKNTHLGGHIRLGVFSKEISFPGGIIKRAGISNASIYNCSIGDNVYINQVHNHIANYTIEDEVVIDNVDLLAVESESRFGNGTEVEIVNEAGGREIPIYDELSAQTAYILAFYRHRPEVVSKLEQMITEYAESVRSSRGVLGRGTKITNSSIIRDVKSGPATVIEGINRLENGSINSTSDDPVYVGPGVFAEDFIFSSGSKVTDGTIISACFVGQGTELAKQYSAENSVFFANCGGFHGEACAIFAGPYTVTHHKSTLLIAGYFSFLNAGSGTNQSNHMYKLGPAHQGIVGRGSKTASDSYMLWPAKVGAFTVVMGRHYRNSDTSELPFSYLVEHEDESVLAPGVNLRSVGTVRDARKWPKRDKRKGQTKYDLINFKLLSPYTIDKMLQGKGLLEELRETCGERSEYYSYHNVRIKNNSLRRGIELYGIGISKFLGNCLIKRLENKEFSSKEELTESLRPESDTGPGQWLDLAGMFAPAKAIEQMLSDIEGGRLGTLEEVRERFRRIHNDYGVYEWSWASDLLEKELGKKIEDITARDIIEVTRKWQESVVELDHILYSDAGKEFAETAQIGYGIDGDEEVKRLDFESVRGKFEENDFVKEVQRHIEAKKALGEELISRLEKLL